MQRPSGFRFYFRTTLAVTLVGARLTAGGCAGLAVGAGATAGIAAYEERSIRTVAHDTGMTAKIKFELAEAGEKYFLNVGVEVYEGRALMTGAVANENMRAEAIKIAWKVDGVKEVLNEIQINELGFTDTAKDTWATAQLISKMTLDKNIRAINYNAETVNGIVYLIGLAMDQAELDRVVSHAQSIGYVRRVISHVRVREQPL